MMLFSTYFHDVHEQLCKRSGSMTTSTTRDKRLITKHRFELCSHKNSTELLGFCMNQHGPVIMQVGKIQVFPPIKKTPKPFAQPDITL